MPSTSAELALVEPPRDKEPSRFVLGCRVLLNLLAASLPSSLEQERLALEVLRVLSSSRRPESRPDDDVVAERDLTRALEQLTDERTVAVLTATSVPKQFGAWLHRGEQRRRERGRLLFIITVYVGGTVLRFPGPSKLVSEGVVGGRTETNRLLRWLGRGVPVHGDRPLRRLFLDVARDSLLNDPGVSDTQDARAFMREPWIWQLLVLERHRLLWKGTPRGAAAAERSPGMALEPGTLEYELAREGGFSRLRRQAGSEGRESLDRMGYADYQARGLRWPITIALLALTMAVLGTVAFAIGQARVRAWDKKNGETASVLRERARAEDAPAAGAPR